MSKVDATMGQKHSQRSSHRRVQSAIDNKIQELIRQKEANPHTTIHPFNKILLKFPIISRTFKSIKSAFDECDENHNGTIEYDELEKAMRSLGSSCEAAAIKDVFHEADLYDNGHLTFKEFLVSLALGYLLGQIPVLLNEEKESSDSKPASERAAEAAKHSEVSPPSSSVLPANQVEQLKGMDQEQLHRSLKFGDGAAISYAFHLALEAFFHLDTKHRGVIHQDELRESMARLALMSPTAQMREDYPEGALVNAAQHSQLLNFLTEDRWRELDWDKDGQITFKEFLFAFVAWVGIDDDDEDDEETAPAEYHAASTHAESFAMSSHERSPSKSSLKHSDSQDHSHHERKVRISQP